MTDNLSRSDYKLLKEEFVSGHKGTTVSEIGLVVTTAPISVLLRFLICAWIFKNRTNLPIWLSFLTDFFILHLPLLIIFTVLGKDVGESVATLSLVVVGLILMLYMVAEIDSKNQKDSAKCALAEIPMKGRRAFVAWFRAYVLIATAISVLAVDFNVFPRKFCKAETYGTGLMDVGVGSFIVTNAIISPEARGKIPVPRHPGIVGKVSSHLKIVWKTIFACIPLIVIGVGRVLTVKGVEYQEHVTEYGVHWNFFFTLAVVRIAASLVYCIVPTSLSWMLALLVGIGYQCLLQQQHLKNFILHGSDGAGSRNGFLEANREGIFSCLGYLAIFFASVQIGKVLMKQREKLKDWFGCLVLLLVLDAIFWTILYFTEQHVEPVSRRLANLPYVLWMMVYNLQIIAFFILCEIIQVLLVEKGWTRSKHKKDVDRITSPKFCLLEAVNRNGLFYFLFSNILTGVVNMSVDTIFVSAVNAVLILAGYMFAVSLVVAGLHVKNITLKL